MWVWFLRQRDRAPEVLASSDSQCVQIVERLSHTLHEIWTELVVVQYFDEIASESELNQTENSRCLRDFHTSDHHGQIQMFEQYERNITGKRKQTARLLAGC